MRRIGGHLDDRSAEEEFVRAQAGDDVSHRQLELLNRKRAGVAEADERAAAADELLELLQIGGGELIRVFGPDRASVAAAAAASRRRSGHRYARIVSDDQHVDAI